MIVVSNWIDNLISEYKTGQEELLKLKDTLKPNVSYLDAQDLKQIDSMIGSMSYSVEWLEKGRQPDSYRGIDKKDAYRLKYYEDMDILPDINEELRKEREPLYLSREQRRLLLNLIRSFSNRERQCFIMYEAEGLSMQKIADRLGISKGTVQTYINRAKKKIDLIVS